MIVKIVSDFHVENWSSNRLRFEQLLDRYFPVSEEDSETALCCCGDMGSFAHFKTTYGYLIDILSKRFKYIIFVAGNHSYYNTEGIWGYERKVRGLASLPANVFYLLDDFKVLDGVAFIGSTLWTDFYISSPMAMYQAAQSMWGFRCIKKQTLDLFGKLVLKSVTPEDTVERHSSSLFFIKEAMRTLSKYPQVILTHHAPSAQSVHARYSGDLLNAAFYSNLEDLITHYQPTLCGHGHMHDSVQYQIADTTVVCNPLGYHAVSINSGFDPNLSFNVGSN